MMQVNLPLISVIVPVFNGEKYLRESRDSIQSYYHLRTELERYFRNMDSQLENGGRSAAAAEALAGFEAHRAEYRLMLAVPPMGQEQEIRGGS